VEVFASRSSENIKVVVEDNGTGISDTEMPYIFDKFYRGDQSQSIGSRRTGLGLAISKGIINAHGGKISVTSHPGQTSFSFTIPQSPSY
jgi:signal transduction histidine kinase